MLPHQGQAGAQAIEDGAALGIMLSQLALDVVENLDSEGGIGNRLRMFEKVRMDRASAMQIFSNVGQDQGERIQREAQRYVKGPVPGRPQEFQEWNFGHDVVRESLAVRDGGEGGRGSEA